MEDSEPFNIEPLFAGIEDEIIRDLSITIHRLRWIIENIKKDNKKLLSENFRFKNELKIVNSKLRKQKFQ